MDAGLDTGDMLLMERLPIEPDDSTARLHDKLAALGGRLIVQALAQMDTLKRRPQPTEGVTYAHKIEKHEAEIDWSQPAEVVRAFDPFPGTALRLARLREPLKLWRARALPGAAAGAPAGTVVSVADDGIVVACGDGGALALLELQKPGGKRLPAAAFLQGFPMTVGQVLTGKA